MSFIFGQLNLLNAVYTTLAVVCAAVVIMAQARKTAHEQLTQTAKDWQDIAMARNERVNLLQSQLSQLQDQILTLSSRITGQEKDRDFLMERNLDLQRQLELARGQVIELEKAIIRDRKP